MDYRLWEIIDGLSETEYKTSTNLGVCLGISEKTIRTRIRELNEIIMLHGAEVLSKPRYGYFLKITSLKEWEEFLKTRGEWKGIPADSKERMDYLLASFLNRNDYIKLEDLSEFLFISQKTLSNELKKVEYILNQFEIILERKPYYGVRAVGKEFNKRNCILQNFILNSHLMFGVKVEKETDVNTIAEVVLKLSSEYNVRFSETAFQNTVLYIYLSISRIKRGMVISELNIASEDHNKIETKMASELYEKLQNIKELQISEEKISKAEIVYTGIFIAGKRFVVSEGIVEPNFVISERTDHLVSRILDNLYVTYNVELRDDLNLRIMLNQHLIPLEIRLKYGIPIENTVLEEVKEKYFFAYTMGQQAAAIVGEEFGKVVSDVEAASLAMYFALAMEEQKSTVKRKKNILLVCVSGNASSRMLMYRFQQEFGEYINSLESCGIYDLEQFELKNIDFIFSTVPIYKKVSVPIMQIHDFMKSSEIMAVRQVLQLGDFQFLSHFYQEKYFFSDIQADSKEEVIHEMCKRMRDETVLPDDFEDSVLARESFGATDFGNLIAIPHPCKRMTDETIVAVAVLKKEIKWSTHMVRVVIMTTLADEKTDEIQKFYDITTRFMMNKEAVLRLIEKADFDNFIELLWELGTGR